MCYIWTVIKWRQCMNCVKFVFKHCWIAIFIFINWILTSVPLIKALHCPMVHYSYMWIEQNMMKNCILVTTTVVTDDFTEAVSWMFELHACSLAPREQVDSLDLLSQGLKVFHLKEVEWGEVARPKLLLDLLTSNYPPNKWPAINKSLYKRNL